LYADRWGRRTVTITGGIVLSACMLVVGSLYASNSVHTEGAGKWLVIVLIFAFAMTYASTWAVVSKIYASEIQPMPTRAAANSIAQSLNFVRTPLPSPRIVHITH
jgi:MFS family permease